tara:strand:- start:52 stop:738 length:687 start_codon:yes stop_codon:yes gene_type:complete
MKKLLGIVVLSLLLSGNAYAANEGSGPIKFPPKFEKRFKDYLTHVENKKKYKYVFAFHPDGANDWQAIKSESDSKSYRIAEKRALKACKKKAKKKECKVFARGAQIVWNWDSIPSAYYTLIEMAGAFDYINWKDVSVEVGKGPISLSKDTEKKFQEYLTIYENNKDEDGFSIYFAISRDGKNSGDFEGSSKQKSQIKRTKAIAIAECMSNNNKEKCYLYAINDKIVWK